ncbi:MAG: LysM domain-containing protein [Acidimicrobiales bacterium]
MAAVELLESYPLEEAPRYLRLVSEVPPPWAYRQGHSLSERRHARVRSRVRRNRFAAGVVLAVAIGILSVPGHVFGATTGAGLSSDLATSSTLASGMEYVVQPGDTLNSIAREMNPVDPAQARGLLVGELGSSVVVPGEHVLIP